VTVDRYTKALLTVIALALAVIAVHPWLPPSLSMDAIRPDTASAQTTTPKYELAIPQAWGKLVSFSNNNLLLEAPDHTLRVVDVEGKAPEYPKIKMLLRWQ
jgi:hypothetical protein